MDLAVTAVSVSGTFCRFSVRCRAVTTTSCSCSGLPPPAAASELGEDAVAELPVSCAAAAPAARRPHATRNAPESLLDMAEPPLTRQPLLPFAVVCYSTTVEV